MAEPAAPVKVPGLSGMKKQHVWIAVAIGAGVVGYAYFTRGGKVEEAPVEGELGADLPPADSFAGATVPGGSTVSGGDLFDPSAPPRTNQEWMQRLIDLLENVGVTPEFSSATLGKYLAGQPLNGAERVLVQTALGLLGNPPGGALPIIHEQTPSTPPPTTKPKPGFHRLAMGKNHRFGDVAKRFGTTIEMLKKLNPGRFTGKSVNSKLPGGTALFTPPGT